MKTLVLDAAAPGNLRQAADVLRQGGLVAFPTDTVYGLGALAFDGAAVARIYAAKDRRLEKGIPVLIASAAELPLVAATITNRTVRLVQQFWPGPLTIVVPKNPSVPETVAGPTVGVRVPDHTAARGLLALSGPLAVTSANISGAQSPATAEAVLNQLDGRVEIVLDGGSTPGGIPSTVVDCTGEELIIVREGPISLDDLRAALR